MKQYIEQKDINKWSEKIAALPDASIIRNCLNKTELKHASMDANASRNYPMIFSDVIPTGKIQNQEKSGRCWIFAGMNFLRQKAIKKNQLEDIIFSAAYLTFWNNVEKANYVLEAIIDTRKEPLDSQIVRWIMENPVNDGGQWEMLCNLVNKYGIVPASVMPENQHSNNTNEMNRCIASKLRKAACVLRRMSDENASVEKLRRKKEEIMAEFYQMFSLLIGEPPQRFDYEYYDKKGQFHRLAKVTPREFYQIMVDVSMNEYVSLVNAPMYNKKMSELYTVKYLGNVWEGEQIKYLNVEMSVIKEMVLKQLAGGEGVWFGSDVMHMCDKGTGIMAKDLYHFDNILHVDFSMEKGERLDYGESRLNHAMVITGVNLNDGVPNRWKIENSWGEEYGDKGYFVMDDRWFDEYVYQVTIHKKYLSYEMRKMFEQSVNILEPWDPLGSLA